MKFSNSMHTWHDPNSVIRGGIFKNCKYFYKQYLFFSKLIKTCISYILLYITQGQV